MLSASSACGPGARGIGLTCENVPERHPQVGQRLEKARARSLQSGDSDSDVATSCRFLCKRGRFRRRVPLAAWQPKLGRRCRRNRSPAPAWWGKERTRRARRRARSVHVLSPRFALPRCSLGGSRAPSSGSQEALSFPSSAPRALLDAPRISGPGRFECAIRKRAMYRHELSSQRRLRRDSMTWQVAGILSHPCRWLAYITGGSTKTLDANNHAHPSGRPAAGGREAKRVVPW